MYIEKFTYIYIFPPIYIYIYICINICIYVCMYACMYVCMYLSVKYIVIICFFNIHPEKDHSVRLFWGRSLETKLNPNCPKMSFQKMSEK